VTFVMPITPPLAIEQPKKLENGSRLQQLDRPSRREPTAGETEILPISIQKSLPQPPVTLTPPVPSAAAQAQTPQAHPPHVSKPVASKSLEGIAAIAQSLAVGASKPTPPQAPMSPPTSRPRPRSDTTQLREELGDRPVMMVSTKLFEEEVICGHA